VVQGFVFNVHVDADGAGVNGKAFLFHRGNKRLTGQFANRVVGAIVKLVVDILVRAVVANAKAAVHEVQHDAGIMRFTGFGDGGVDCERSRQDRAGLLGDRVLESLNVFFRLLFFSRADNAVIDRNAKFFFKVRFCLKNTDLNLTPETRRGRRRQVDDIIGLSLGNACAKQPANQKQGQNDGYCSFHG